MKPIPYSIDDYSQELKKKLQRAIDDTREVIARNRQIIESLKKQADEP